MNALLSQQSTFAMIRVLFLPVPNSLKNCSFEGSFFLGDFVSVSQERAKEVQVDDEQPAAESDKFSSELLTCPNKGCV